MQACPVCRGEAAAAANPVPGYRAGTTFQVFVCCDCDASFAWPLDEDPTVYEQIYRQVIAVPGFWRYDRYRAAVESKGARALEILAQLEAPYWGIARALDEIRRQGEHLVALDIGSGLGYLTYALRMKGLDAFGIEGSVEAVAVARRTFGNHYSAVSLAAHSLAHYGEYDLVIMSEMIEHAADAPGVFERALALLRTGGRAIVTTPNKSAFAPTAAWQTTAPPVHLWWFSENSMRALAERHGCTVSFVDYSAFNRRFGHAFDGEYCREAELYGPTLDDQGRVMGDIAVGERLQLELRLLRLRAGIHISPKQVARQLRSLVKPPPARSYTMCAVFTKP